MVLYRGYIQASSLLGMDLMYDVIFIFHSKYFTYMIVILSLNMSEEAGKLNNYFSFIRFLDHVCLMGRPGL